ncbi:uncharacterized protein LOC129956469 [Argiope bruennichi]|uniref:uncharacterized protein LOC129956469 n=1 Tax=Argiope bruennichi TaxID=94029 RepID=UPI0024950F15|nr:uncharacterized protein LOC129956469 [Argiope bruennichi]
MNKCSIIMDPFQSSSPDGGLNPSITKEVPTDALDDSKETISSVNFSAEAESGNEHADPDKEKWNKFLESFIAKFSEYEMQKNRSNYNVVDLEDWGKQGRTQGIAISSDSFGIFMEKISHYGLDEYNDIKRIRPTEMQLKELNNALNFTLNYRQDIWCKDENIFVKGNYVSLLEIMDYGTDRLGANNNCGNYLDQLKAGKLKMLNIFALNTVFIDRDISYPLNLISQKWEVIGNRRLDLKGAEGPPHVKPAAPDGTWRKKNGEHGKPGLPGKPGGTVFGIGSTFVNGANLTISVNGGIGGPGQRGGNGDFGDSGPSAYPPNQSGNLEEVLSYGVTVDGFKWEKTYYVKYDASDSFHLARERMSGFHPFDIFFHEAYKFFGKTGEKGGDGGSGGKGGKGGKPGSITLIEFGSASKIKEQMDYGEEGAIGKGGSGGKSGKTGDDLIARVYVQRPIQILRLQGRKDYLWWVPKEYIPNNSYLGQSGKNGVDGDNDVGRQEPESGAAVDGMDSILNEYKIFIRENLANNLIKAELLQFLYHLNNNRNVTDFYQTLGLVGELTGLEEQFPKLHDDVDFAPFYESLLNRTSEYGKNPKEGEDSREHKKVLNYLYTTTLGRMCNLREEPETNLVVNIGGYLDLVKKDIEVLKELQNQSNKANIINKYKENYKTSVDKNIDEAKAFIQKQITPEIGNIGKEIDNKVDLLLKEIMKLQEKAEEEKETLIQKRKELESTLALGGLFSGLQIFGQVVSFLGPIGTAVGSVIETTTSVADSLILNNASPRLLFAPNIMPDLKSLANQVKTVKIQKIVYLDNLIQEILQNVKNSPEKLEDITVSLQKIKVKLANVRDENFNVKELSAIEMELKQVLKKKEDDLISEKDDPKEKNSKALAIVEKFSQIVKLGPQILDVYKRYKGDQSKMDTLNSAITQAENKLQQLKAYEENIYNTFIPMLHNLETSLYDTAGKLSNKSQVSLDVTKWQVQSTLKDIKLQIQKATDGFEVKENLARCIEKLEEVMTSLINIYDRIQNYQEQQKLASYIADISSVAASNIHITDPLLINATNRMEETIRSNLVLMEYKRALDAFKQWVFPFAEYYLGKFVLPSHLKLDKNIEDLVTNAANQIEIMKQKIDLYKISVKNTDKYIQNGEFSSRWKSTDPFFVWKNENYKDEISKLLSGQEVVLKADVRSSAPDKDAIKFSVIELIFKSRNETLQPRLSEALTYFDIRATHLGNSHYRYADEVYLITSDSQTILYSYEKNSVGEPVRKNNVFDKIKSGDLMLSPYALWEFKLRNSTSKSSFAEIGIFKDEIDLELSGYGSYVLRDVDLFSVIGNTEKKIKKNAGYSVTAFEEDREKSNQSHASLLKTDGSYMTNGASIGLSSPVNYISNLLKTYILSNAMFSVHRIFFSKKLVLENKNNNIGIQNGATEDLMKLEDYDSESKFQNTDVRTREIEKETTEMISECSAANKSVSSAEENNPGNDAMKQKVHLIRMCGDSKDHGDRSDTRLLLGNQELQSNHLNHLPDINCSLLLADLISRTISGKKYITALEESLLSPQEMIQKKLNNLTTMGNEGDIKQHLHLLSSEVDGRENSWLNRAKRYFRSAFQFFGMNKIGSPEDYVQDIRNLFSTNPY